MGARSKVTLTDVALRAGVSATTASYILNGRSTEMRISADAERRVRDAAAALRYRPNRSARILRTDTGRGATRTIAVVSDELAGGLYASRMLEGARVAARQRDHLLVVGETGGDPDLVVRVIEEMLDRQVDGIVFATFVTGTVDVPAVLTQTSAVLLNCLDPAGRWPSVMPDELSGGVAAARAAVAALAEGDRVWLVGGGSEPSAMSGGLRHQGLLAGLHEAGFSVSGTVPCAWTVPAAYDAVCDWLAAGGRAQVLVCLNDRIAMGTYQALTEHQLAVPHDVSVVSFDGSELATWLRPPVTSVRIPYAEMGALAVRVLLEPGSLPVVDGEVLRVPMPVVPGGSVRPVDSTAITAR